VGPRDSPINSDPARLAGAGSFHPVPHPSRPPHRDAPAAAEPPGPAPASNRIDPPKPHSPHPDRPVPASRRWHHEFWPAWLLYAPLLPWIALLALRHRSLMACLAANPGIEKGGGLIDESKFSIARGFHGLGTPGFRHAATALVPAGQPPALRADAALALIDARPDLGGFPVILKPDAGQRGHGVRLARTPDDVRAYFVATTRAVIVQEYAPGPEECGILWIRRYAPGAAPPGTRREGFIFAITRKQFPVIAGDGSSTLEALVRAHQRYRLQASVFLARHAAQRGRVLAAGERLRLAEAGNHAQGAIFLDGSDLITPALEDAADALARAFPDPAGRPGGLDFGRFDVRYESDDALRAGRGLVAVEFNGTSAEATALYDPSRGPLFAYRLLLAQWGHLFRVGAARVRAGATPPRFADALRWLRDHRATRDGSPIAD